MNKSNSKYNWFINKDNFQFDTQGVELKLDTLKLILLDSNKQYKVRAKNHTYKIMYEAKIKDSNNALRYFGISKSNDNNKLFILRLNSEKKYDPTLLYKKGSFLALCTEVSRKLK